MNKDSIPVYAAYKYSWLLALTVVFIYCIDHYCDYKKQNVSLAGNLPLTINLLAILSTAAIALYLLFAQQWYQLLTIPSMLIAGLPVVVYFVISKFSNLNKNGTKEVIISATVFLAIHFPDLVENPTQIANDVWLLLPLLANTFTFSYFEIEKDKTYGFNTFFTHKRDRGPYQQALLITSFIAFVALLVSGLNDFSCYTGSAISCILYVVAVLFKHKLFKWPFYRMLLESILLLLLV